MRYAVDRELLAGLSEQERAEVERDLRELDELRLANPLAFFHPHPKQDTFLSSNDALKAFLGGNRSGKTTAGIVDDLIQTVDRDSLPEHLKPYKKWDAPFYCRIVAPDFVSTMEGVIFQKIREWAPKGQLQGGSWEQAYDKQRRILRFANGSWWQFLTFEQDLDKHSGAALHRVHFDEEPPEDVRQECLMRLIDYGGDELFTMTPLYGMTWMFDRVYERRHLPGTTVVQVDMDDNPHLTDEAKTRALEGLTTEERQARKEGRFVHFAGVVFPEFRDSAHVTSVPDKRTVKQQQIVVGIDPGIRWTGVSWTAFDDDNAALTYDELYLEQHTVPDVAAAIKAINTKWGAEPMYYVIDPSARNRTQINADAVEAEFQRHGIYAIHGQNDRESGILQMKRRLQGNPPSWLISEGCPRLIHEIGRYRYDPKAPNTFDVMKVDDHVLDSVRYGLMSRSWGVARSPEQRRRRGGYNPGFEEKWEPSEWKPDPSPIGYA